MLALRSSAASATTAIAASIRAASKAAGTSGSALMTRYPDFFMAEWFYSEGALNQGRSYGYANERADELILAAQSEMDPVERKAMYDELQAIVAEEVPFTPLYHEATIYATRDNVKDLRLDVQFKPSIDEAYLTAE